VRIAPSVRNASETDVFDTEERIRTETPRQRERTARRAWRGDLNVAITAVGS
jgi:hypothetical protein